MDPNEPLVMHELHVSKAEQMLLGGESKNPEK